MSVIQYQRTEWLAEHIYTHTTNRQQNILISTTSGETFHAIYNTNQKNINNPVLHLGSIYLVQLTSTYCKTCIIHPITFVTISSM